ncbi:MAG: 2Fe-2S iron-sulfur cluster binding domain-containing protein [Ferrovum sp.]|nr:2Fe-2S iron-sulfur cluster binding domain-containing protein [Ferrovum sp.]NDU86735.1 2Fe-2S iron-sulfur cluster binding domain-containing protein [Ferrovum sp.]
MIELGGKVYECAPPHSVLEALTAQGEAIPSGCRAGVCQSCLMRCLKGTPPAKSQEGLKTSLVQQGYFLACRCYPESDLTVALGDGPGLRQSAIVVRREMLNRDILALYLRPEAPFAYRPGQFLRLHKEANLSRCYSLASVPEFEDTLELHVRRIPDGRVSGWVHDTLAVGETVEIGDSTGHCFYVPERQDHPVLLLGTGSGLAPLYGIVRDALAQGHHGPVWLYHGSYALEGLYRQAALQELARRYPNFHYVPCVDQTGAAAEALGARTGTVLGALVADHGGFSKARVFLCGNPDMVKDARLKIFLGGASMADIFADPFLPSGS